MKLRTILGVVSVSLLALSAPQTFAQTISPMSRQPIVLPSPDRVGGMPFNEVISLRASERNFDATRPVSDETLGQLLWLTVGVNRPDAPANPNGNKVDRSNPTARNWQEVEVYVFSADAVWHYNAAKHTLFHVVDGDHRGILAGGEGFKQDFVMDAPYSILFVADLSELPDTEGTSIMTNVDVGIACQNLNLACVSLGLGTVPRGTMDKKAVAKLLGLSERQLPVINNPVGYVNQQ